MAKEPEFNHIALQALVLLKLAEDLSRMIAKQELRSELIEFQNRIHAGNHVFMWTTIDWNKNILRL